VGAIHFAHSACTDLGGHDIRAETRAGTEGQEPLWII